jgi:hypothetical protein
MYNHSRQDFALSVELLLDLSLEYKERCFGGDEEVSHFCLIKKVNKINPAYFCLLILSSFFSCRQANEHAARHIVAQVSL